MTVYTNSALSASVTLEILAYVTQINQPDGHGLLTYVKILLPFLIGASLS